MYLQTMFKKVNLQAVLIPADVHAEAACMKRRRPIIEECWGRDSDLPFSELVHWFVKITLCHKMGRCLSEPKFRRCPIAACAKKRGCDVPEKGESEGKRHLVEQQKGQRRGRNRKWEKGGRLSLIHISEPTRPY